MVNQDRKRQIISHLMQVSKKPDGEEREFFTSGEIKDETVASTILEPCFGICRLYRRSTGEFSGSALLAWAESIYRIINDDVKIDILTHFKMNIATLEILDKLQDEKEKEKLIIKTQDDILQDSIDFSRNPENHIRSRKKILSWLIANDRLRIRFAYLKNHDYKRNTGMFHNKFGYFKFNEGVRLAFIGSFNETRTGHYNNAESATLKFSYRKSDKSGVEYLLKMTDQLWDHGNEMITVANVSDETLSLARELSSGRKPPKETISKVEDQVNKIQANEMNESKLWDHQIKTINDWEEASYSGLVKHATGSGKTLTALFALRRHLIKYSSALILVPTKALLDQWYEEVQKIIPDAQIMRAGTGHEGWKRESSLAIFTRESEDQTKKKILIAINNTARSQDFLLNLSDNQKLFVIADEVHNLGSKENSKIFNINTTVKLGLSATPERYFDPEGTTRIFDFFGEILPTTYDLEQGIEEGRLVPYDYYPETVRLKPSEQDDFDETSDEIRRLAARCPRDVNDNIIISKQLQLMIFERSRIIKKAENKIGSALRILQEHYQTSEQWLVYCESKEQVDKLINVLNNQGFDPFVYHSDLNPKERKGALSRFKSTGGVLLSIKCLDEGVNIPSTTHALIMASDQNPRQFIQRRGRVLRKDKESEKTHATIFDLMVSTDGFYSDEMKNFVKTELHRAYTFAANSRNNILSRSKIDSIATMCGLELDQTFDLSEDKDNIYDVEEDME